MGTYLPRDAEITFVKLGLYFNGTPSGASSTLSLFPLTRADTSTQATWNIAATGTNWTTAGGDYSTGLTSSVLPVSSASSGQEQFYPNPQIVTDWLNGSAPMDGFEIRETNESTASFSCYGDSSVGTGPYYNIAWQFRTGLRGDQQYLSHSVDSHEQVNINYANGNLVDLSNEFSNNAPGIPLSIDRTYNSDQATATWSNGLGWYETPQDSGVGSQDQVNAEYAYDGAYSYSPAINGDDPFYEFQPSPFSTVGTGNTTAWTTPPGSGVSATNDASGNNDVVHNSSQVTEVNGASAYGATTALTSRSGLTETINRSSSYFPGTDNTYVTSVQTTSGRTYTFTNAASGYLTGISAPTINGTTPSTAYTYSGGSTYNTTAGDGELLTATDADSGVTHYGYDSSDRLVGIESPAGREITFTYNTYSQVTSMTYVSTTTSCSLSAPTSSTCPGDTYTLAYTQPTSTGATCTGTSTAGCGTTVVTDPNGHNTTYYWNSADEIVHVTDPLGHARSASYDVNADAINFTDNTSDESQLGYSTDGLYNPTTSTTPGGAVTTLAGYGTASANSQGVYPGADYEPGSEKDSQGNTTSFGYDTSGQLSTVTPPTGAGSQALTDYYQGDAKTGGGTWACGGLAGELCESVDGDGNITTYAYAANGDLTTVTPAAVSVGTGIGATSLTNDAWGRPTTIITGNDTPRLVQSANTQISSSGVSSVSVTLSHAVAPGDALVLMLGSDPTGTLSQVSSISGGGVSWVSGAAGGSDAAGDDELWYGVASSGTGGTTITATLAANTERAGATVMEFAGVAATSPLDGDNTATGSSTTLVPTPALTTTQPGDLVVASANTVNGLSANPATPWQNLTGPEDDGGGYYNPIAYQAAGAAGSYTTSWSQTPANAWATAVIALRQAFTTYTYNNLGQITEVENDGVTGCTSTDSTDINAGRCIIYGYDADGNLTSRIDATGTSTFGFDFAGYENSTTIPGTSNTSSVIFDADHNATSYTDPGGTVGYFYDAADELVGLDEPGGNCPSTVGTSPDAGSGTTSTKCTTFGYTTDGQRNAVTYPNGETIALTYNSDGDEATITAKNGATSFFTRTISYKVGTADTALVQSWTGTDTLSIPTGGYDSLNRLHQVTLDSKTYTYTYDEAGNRLSAGNGTTTTYAAYNPDNELCWTGTTSGSSCATTPSGDTAATYDADGDQLTAASVSATYNPADQTTSLTGGTTTSSFGYADVGQNLRTSSTTSSTTTSLLDGLEGVGGQSVGTNSPIYFTRDPNGNLISMRVGAGSTGTSYYYLDDELGSVVALTNASDAEVATYKYDPYGNSTVGTNTSISINGSGGTQGAANVNPYRYATGYYDSTGLYKLGARYYNPGLGTWTQKDPEGQGNLFAYAGDEPLNSVDPSGDSFFSDLGSALDITSVVSSAIGDTLDSVGLEGVGLYFDAAGAALSLGAAAADCVGGAADCGAATDTALIDTATFGVAGGLSGAGLDEAAFGVSGGGLVYDVSQE